MTKTKFISVLLSMCMILSVFSLSAMAQAGVVVEYFDYNNIKIAVSGDVADASVFEAMIYVYEGDINDIDDDNPPIYTDFINLTEGVFENKEILLPLTLSYGTYNVALYFDGSTSPLTDSFTYYSPSDRIENRKLELVEEAKGAKDGQALKDILFEVNSDGGLKEPVNEVLFTEDVDFTVYNTVSDTLEVYNRMLVKGFDGVDSLSDLVDLFEACAQEQKAAETRPAPSSPSSPGSDNTTTGSSNGGFSVSGGSSWGGSSSGGSSAPSEGGSLASVFPDMKGHWAESYANTLSEKKIINGYEDGTFKGENKVTRAELVKMLVTGFNLNGTATVSFTDVADGSWYKDFVLKASGAGIVNGYDGKFNPDGQVTRQDAALMLYRVLENNGKKPSGEASFADEAKISDYAALAVKALGSAKILLGDTNGNFNPDAPITRAEIAACLCRTLDYVNIN